MSPPILALIFSLLIPLSSSSSFSSSSSSSAPPDRFLKPIPSSLRYNASREYFELTKPLPSDKLTPQCSLRVLSHRFGNTYGLPPVTVMYSPPANCTAPWSRVVLQVSATCRGEQYDRIAGVWLDGVEILRTSTAEPTEDGVFWKVRKDVTRYTSLLAQSNLTLSVMLENLVNDVFTGAYHVNVSLLYYNATGVRAPLLLSEIPIQGKLNRKLMSASGSESLALVNGERGSEISDDDNDDDDEFNFESEESDGDLGFVRDEASENLKGLKSSFSAYETPADLIIPMSSNGDAGPWFRIQSQSDVRSMGIQIPPNTFKAVLEVYVSFHGNDEFWYSNPPDSYIRLNNLTTERGNGAYREVFVKIDGNYVGSVVPFPVIFTGGINPLFWEPVVAIGAFNLPSYDLDLSPFLGLLLDGNVHVFEIGVADGISFWLVDANLHLWLDQCSSAVQAKPIEYNNPEVSIERSSKFKQLDGSFEVEAERETRFSGWVNSTAGNFTTQISQEFKFKNKIKFKENGAYKIVKQKVKTKTEIRVRSDNGNLISRTTVKRKYPITVITTTRPGLQNGTVLMNTNVSNSLSDKVSSGDFSRNLYRSLESWGWMEVQDHSVLSGAGNTNQSLSVKDEFGCYSRTVAAANGTLVSDNTTSVCLSSS